MLSQLENFHFTVITCTLMVKQSKPIKLLIFFDNDKVAKIKQLLKSNREHSISSRNKQQEF